MGRITAYRTLRGEAAKPFIPSLAALRIQVFREYPYLYEGDLSYEEKYLQDYSRIPDSVVVLALDGERVVGASTALPLTDSHPEFCAPFSQQGFHPESIFYLGESVLDPAYRGQGAGHVFFDEREKAARSIPGMVLTTFCAVERPVDHPRKPVGYRPLDEFWNRRGYVRQQGLQTSFSWKEVGQPVESAHPMVFWTHELAATPVGKEP